MKRSYQLSSRAHSLISKEREATKHRPRVVRRLSEACAVTMEALETRTLFGGGYGLTGPYTTGQGPCCGVGSGPQAGGSSSTPTKGQAGSPGSSANTGAHTNTFSTSQNPVDYLTGSPYVYADDLVSDGFGLPWGVTRNWVGQDNASQFGNGWVNTSQPYLILNKQDPDPIIEEVVDGVTQDAFSETASTVDGVTTYTDSPILPSVDQLVYVPPTEETVNGEYRLTDSSGDVTTFYGLARNGSAVLTNSDVYPQEPIEQTDGTYLRLGAFLSFEDTFGNVTTTTYDSSTGNLLDVNRSDAATGEEERFAYSYATISDTTDGGSASMVSQVVLERRPNSSASWQSIQGVDYSYYTGDSTDAAYGRLGDLKTATMWNSVDDSSHVTSEDYYRYYKFWGTSVSSDYEEEGPTGDPSTSGGTDDTYPEEGGDSVVASGLSVVVQGENFSRLLTAYGSLASIESQSNASLVPYADNTFDYERYQYDTIQAENHGTGYRVTEETSEGGGCSCMGNDGVGVFTYAYETNPDYSAQNPLDVGTTFNQNQWAMKTTVGLPSTTPGATSSDNEQIVYTNAIGEVMLSVAVDADTAEPTYYQYDSNGRVIMTVEPSALESYDPSDPSDYEDNADLVGFDASTTTYENILSTTGLIETTAYGASTTATSDDAGNVQGYFESQAVQQGYLGIPIITSSQQYISRTNSDTGATIYPIASSTVYRNNDGTGAETTTYAYNWSGDSYAMTGMTVTAPVISAAENGSGSADVMQTIFDSYGRSVWVTDPNGRITYSQYDPGTGAIVEEIQDVDPATVSDPVVAGPSTSPSGTLNLTTISTVDGLGRPTKVIDPNGNATFYAYDDFNQAVFEFPGATETVDGSGDGTLTTTGPAQMVRAEIPFAAPDEVSYDYSETMTFSGTVSVSGGEIVLPGFIRGDSASTGPSNVLDLVGDGTTSSPQFTIQSLSREMYNTGNQVVEADAYTSVSETTYLATAPNSQYSGTASTFTSPSGNFNPTIYGYDGQGNQDRVVMPTGTITRSVYNGLGEIVSEWVGTNDTPTSGWWSTSNPANLVQTESFVYDVGGAGDGNLTQVALFPGGEATPRVTRYYYDWQDRQVAQKSGVLLNEDGTENLSGEVAAAAHDPITYIVYDNLGEAVEQDTYSGDGIPVISFAGVPIQPPAERLQSKIVMSYDDQGGVYRNQQFGVDSATGGMVTISGLTNSTPYYFAVKGNDASTTSDLSNVVEATPSSTPTGAPVLDNVLSGEGDATLTWNPVPGATSYNVSWGTSSLTYTSEVSAGDVNNYTVTGLASGTTFYFAVSAIVSGTETAKSDEQSAITIVQDPSFEGESVDPDYGYSFDPTGGSWTFSGDAGVGSTSSLFFVPSLVPDGSQAAFLLKDHPEMPPYLGIPGGDGVISQSLTLAAGSYILGFYSAAATDLAPQPIEVQIDGTTFGTITPSGSGFHYYDVSFTVSTSGTHTLSFNASGGTAGAYGSVIDDVSVLAPSVSSSVAPPTLYAATAQNGSAILSFGGTRASNSYTIYWGTSPTSLTNSMTVSDTITQNAYYDPSGNLIATIGTTGAATKYAYDGADRNTLAYVTDGGQIDNFSNVSIGSSTAYNAASGVLADIVLTQTQNIYDGDGNVIETITKDRFGTDANTSTGVLGNASGGVFARVSYMASYFDAADRDVEDVNVGTNGSGGVWTRPSNAPSGSSTVLVNTTTYNNAGWVGETTDPLGIAATNTYDMLGETITTIADFTGIGTPSDSSNQVVDYTYDGDGNLTSMITIMPTGETEQVTTYVYGVNSSTGSFVASNDLLYKVEYPDPITGNNSNASGYAAYNQYETYTYDGIGEQLTYTDRNETTHSYSYDQLGRLTVDNVTGSVGSGVDGTVTKLGYAYNDQGLLFSATSYNSGGGILNQAQETYDGFGQLTADAQAHSGNVSSGTPTVGYTYNASNGDRLTAITYPDGRTINYNYNGNSGIDTVLSRISSVSDSSGNLQSYTYLGLDTPVTFNNGNGVALSYLGTAVSTGTGAGDQYAGLDRFGRIAEQNWSTASVGVDQFAYGYDAGSNVTYKQVVTNTSNSTINTTLAALSQLYTYDGLNRLTNASTGTLTVSGGTASISSPTERQGWSLDPLGNWKNSSVNSSSGTVTTNRNNSNQNQVTTVGSATLDYDLNGNTTTDQIGQQYVYDAWNRLVKVTGANGTVLAQDTYDAEGRRIAESQGVYPSSTTTDLYYSSRDQVVQENVGSLVTAEHVWSPFYVDDMIETVTNSDVTTNQSNGSIDTGFGTNTSNHTTTTSLSSSPTSAVSATVSSDIVVAAMVGTTPELIWYNSSGGLDTAYGSGTGIVSLSFTGWTSITSIAIQSNGKIDLAVQTSSGGMNVAQLNSDGSADSSFGASGLETQSSLPAANAVVIAANGDLLVGGVNVSSYSFVVTELHPTSGALDTSYNTSGSTIVPAFTTGTGALGFAGMALAPDGDLILGGGFSRTVSGTSTSGNALIAISPNGTTDSTFGNSGVELDAGAPGSLGIKPSSLTITSMGEILIGGPGSIPSGAFNIQEYNSQGSENGSFGTSSIAHVSIGGRGFMQILAVEANGQIVIGGVDLGNFYLGRFNANGTLDTTFGSSGVETGSAGAAAGLAMVQTVNGETVMIGKPSSGSGIILQEFHTLSNTRTLYVEQDADYNVTSLTDSSGNVVERYSYDPYGNVTVLNPDGTLRGGGTAASSLYGSVYLHQGLRLDVETGLYDDRDRVYDPALGRFLQEDPDRYIDGANMYPGEMNDPVNAVDPSGLQKGGAYYGHLHTLPPSSDDEAQFIDDYINPWFLDEPGFGGSLVPVTGPFRNATYNFYTGHWAKGAGWTVATGLDVCSLGGFSGARSAGTATLEVGAKGAPVVMTKMHVFFRIGDRLFDSGGTGLIWGDRTSKLLPYLRAYGGSRVIATIPILSLDAFTRASGRSFLINRNCWVGAGFALNRGYLYLPSNLAIKLTLRSLSSSPSSPPVTPSTPPSTSWWRALVPYGGYGGSALQ